MDLRAIGFNYDLINGLSAAENIRRKAPSKKEKAEKDAVKTKGDKLSFENQDKGRVIDVSI